MVLVLQLSSHVSLNSSRHSSASLFLSYRCCSDVDSCFLTIEVYRSYIVQQEASLHRVHVTADSEAPRTQIQVHAVQSVSHSINCIDHKLNLPLLLVGRVPTNPLLTCGNTRRSLFTRSNHYSAPHPRPSGVSLPVHFFLSGSSLIPGLVSLHLKSSSQNSLNQMFLRLFSREREVKYWSKPETHTQPD